LGAGVYGSTADIAKLRRADRLFTPKMAAAARDKLYGGWQDAVARVRSDYSGSRKTTR
jgi:glycerol kinase